MHDDYFSDGGFKSQLDAESLLLMQMNRMAIYRDTDKQKYCSSIETFMLICPRNIRDKAFEKLSELGLIRGSYLNINESRLVLYDDLYIYINEQLEKNRMIWKKKSIHTFS